MTAANKTRKNAIPDTYFAPAERLAPSKLKKLARSLISEPIIDVVLKSVGGLVLILDKHRQIAAANQEILDSLNLKVNDSLIGLRPGEALNCEHSQEMPKGCGTTTSCQVCGAVLAILAAQKKLTATQDQCSMAIIENGKRVCREFKVHVTPLKLHGNTLFIFVLHDISSEYRKAVLERSFLHDLRNTLSGIIGWGDLLPYEDNPSRIAKKIVHLSEILSQEIEDHYALFLAENGDLGINPGTITASSVLDSLEAIFTPHKLARNRTLHFKKENSSDSFTTDENLLIRILTNMVKNALEATPEGGTVTIWYAAKENLPGFYVHNDGEIPKDISLQIFQRSFSTKVKKGRGIGTYSMKLYGEFYLKGKVDFVTSPESGTIFSFHFPQNLEPS